MLSSAIEPQLDCNGGCKYPTVQTIRGPGAGVLTIDGGGLTNLFNVFGQSSAYKHLHINDLTLANGRAAEGGLIRTSSNDLRITRCVLKNGVATGSGGALHVAGGKTTIVDSTFHANRAGAGGGAIFGDNVEVNRIRSTVSGNACSSETCSGGGVQLKSSSGVIEYSTITANSAVRNCKASPLRRCFTGRRRFSWKPLSLTQAAHRRTTQAPCVRLAVPTRTLYTYTASVLRHLIRLEASL